MLVFYSSSDLTITGYQTFPDSSDEPHIVVDDSLEDALSAVVGYLKLVMKDGAVVLPADIHVQASNLQQANELAEAKSLKESELKAACENEIVSGFTSSALGSPHFYQSDRDDQLNLIGVAANNQDTPFKCRDEAGEWSYRQHTASQLNKVVADGALVKTRALQKIQGAKERLAAASTVEEVAAITW